MTRPEITSLLAGLQGRDPGEAWEQFLSNRAALLMKIARYHAHREDHAQDCFLYICEKLAEHRFRRLRAFDPDTATPFEAWLSTVTNNLARDWRRRRFGRIRSPRAIAALHAFDREMYRLHFEQELDLTTCRALLAERFPESSPEAVGAALDRIHNALTPRQRWRLSFLNHPGEKRFRSLEGGCLHIAAADHAPEQSAVNAQDMDRLHRALDGLEAEERLLLRLRYEEQLSLREVAGIAGLRDLHQARRKIEQALVKIRAVFPFED